MATSHANAVESKKVKDPIKQVAIYLLVEVNIVTLAPSISASLSEGIAEHGRRICTEPRRASET
jgi:hypothetical protein